MRFHSLIQYSLEVGKRHKQIQDKGLCIDMGVMLNIGGDIPHVQGIGFHVDLTYDGFNVLSLRSQVVYPGQFPSVTLSSLIVN